MRPALISLLTLVLAGAGCSFVTYRLAYNAGFARAKELQTGTFVGTMDALEKLRAGQTDEGIRRVESLCFSVANTLYDDPRYRAHVVTKSLAQPLIQYRETYRTNRADWTPAEQRLEGLLVNWRKP